MNGYYNITNKIEKSNANKCMSANSLYLFLKETEGIIVPAEDVI